MLNSSQKHKKFFKLNKKKYFDKNSIIKHLINILMSLKFPTTAFNLILYFILVFYYFNLPKLTKCLILRDSQEHLLDHEHYHHDLSQSSTYKFSSKPEKLSPSVSIKVNELQLNSSNFPLKINKYITTNSIKNYNSLHVIKLNSNLNNVSNIELNKTKEDISNQTLNYRTSDNNSPLLITKEITANEISERTITTTTISTSKIEQLRLIPLAPTSSPSVFLHQYTESPATKDRYEYCKFWNSTEFKNGFEYICKSKTLTKIPQKLSSVYSLIISSANIVNVRNAALKKYGETLRDITLTDLPCLQNIEGGAFASIKNLRTVYISNAPKLTNLSEAVFTGISNSIKTIRIINSGLMKIPNFKNLQSLETILTMVDLEGNSITNLESYSVNIKTELLSLDNNALTNIDDSAFFGSAIAKLTFIGNRNLKTIHPLAFAGIMNLRELDLSSTSIVKLPSIGLNELEILKVQNTHTLKTIPSIYNLKNLQIAWLTHSFHCCAFKFPSRHDPQRHAKRLKYLEHLKKTCTGSIEMEHHDISEDDDSLDFDDSNLLGNNIIYHQFKSTITDPQNVAESLKSLNHNSEMLLKRVRRGYFGSEKSKRMTINAWENLNESQLSDSNPLSENPLRGSPVNIDINVEQEIAPEDEEYLKSEDIGEFHVPLHNLSTQNKDFDGLCGNVTFRQRQVTCFPIPDALNPCEDVMGSNWLRFSVWVAVLLAVFGNFAVLVVILATRNDGSVPKFLMSHLAFADLCMGLYLLLLASIDAHSMGEYFNYAFDWQYGLGCQVAGSLTVFASHLSVFTLTIITLERWFAITQAMYLNKRIKLKPAKYIMTFGWMYSFLMSSLPLFGISNYSSTSICLPMEVRDRADIAYLVTILGLSGAAFVIIAICYAQIYFSLGSETRRSRNQSIGEMTVAKKMALLVFTNFSCWAPIAFFALTAIAGYPLINVTKSKILLVFFYPLNSCADPYLYALLTAQYRKDLYTLLSKFGICKQKALAYKASVTMLGTNMTTHPGGTTSPLHEDNPIFSSIQSYQSNNSIQSNHSNVSNHSMSCKIQKQLSSPETTAMLNSTEFV